MNITTSGLQAFAAIKMSVIRKLSVISLPLLLCSMTAQQALAGINYGGPAVVTAAPALNAKATGKLVVVGGAAVNGPTGFSYSGATLTYTTPVGGEVATITYTVQRPVTFVAPLGNGTLGANITVNETIPLGSAISTSFTYQSSFLGSCPNGPTALVNAFPPGGNNLNSPPATAICAEKLGPDIMQGVGTITIASPPGDPGGNNVVIVLPNSTDTTFIEDSNSPTLSQWAAIAMALSLISFSVWRIRRGRPSGYTGTA
jgi:hypothetical protein